MKLTIKHGMSKRRLFRINSSGLSLQQSYTCTEFADLALILFLASPLTQTLFSALFNPGVLSQTISISLCYIPALIICVLNPRKYFIIDFWILLGLVGVFFAVTLFFHSDYLPYYTQEEYGLWDYVLKPNRGIYGYFFVRLVNDPKRILKDTKCAGWMMFVYFAHRIIQAKQRGYWNGVAGDDGHVKMTYSVAFGYEVLLFAAVFLYSALKEKKIQDWFAAGLATVMILVGGSRGPILFLVVTVVLFILTELKNSKHKWKIIAAVSTVMILMQLYLIRFLEFVSSIMNRFGASSRFIEKLLSDDISNDSGRDKIWAAAIDMIKDKPLGHGAYGARHVIVNYIIAGYPHNVFLEILIEFGIVFGTILILFLLIGAYNMIFGKYAGQFRSIFLPLFCASCALFVSLTFWGYRPFWLCIALGVCFINNRKRRALDIESICASGGIVS